MVEKRIKIVNFWATCDVCPKNKREIFTAQSKKVLDDKCIKHSQETGHYQFAQRRISEEAWTLKKVKDEWRSTF